MNKIGTVKSLRRKLEPHRMNRRYSCEGMEFRLEQGSEKKAWMDLNWGHYLLGTADGIPKLIENKIRFTMGLDEDLEYNEHVWNSEKPCWF